MDPVLRHYFNNFKIAYEIDTTSTLYDAKKRQEQEQINDAEAFERFSNYVIFSLDDPDIFTADSSLLEFVCCGGGNDTGIDGIGIKVNGRLVRSVEEVQEITTSSRKIAVEFVLVQSKMRQSFDSGEFTKFGQGIKNFFAEKSLLPESKTIKDFRELKNFIYSDQAVISKFEQNPSLVVYYVGIGTVPTDDHFSGSRKLLEHELEDFYFDCINIDFLGGKQLIKICRELDNKFEVQINITDIFPLIVDPKADIKKAYAFTCTAYEFLKILTKEDGLLRRSLFDDNVRDYLGSKGGVNKEIEQTIMESPELFLLCNNGVTIVCTSFDQVRDKLVRIENPQIVNGCQTCNSLYNLRDEPNSRKVQLLVRLISTENPSISNKIVRGTNKQNQVLDEAFEGTLPFHQEVLEPYFIACDGNGVHLYYERRAKQYNNDPAIKKAHIVNLRILTQTFVAMFLDSPHKSHMHEALLLKEYAGDQANRKVFCQDHSPEPYFLCALTWFMFEKAFHNRTIDGRFWPYKAFLYMIFKDLVGEKAPRLTESRALKAYCAKLLVLLEETRFNEEVKGLLKQFDEARAKWVALGRSQYGIKDNDEFTKLLRDQSAYSSISEVTLCADESNSASYHGKVLNIVWKRGIWFGFIKRGSYEDNAYFDSRSYDGDPSLLYPGVEVRYDINVSSRGKYASNVNITDS